MEITESRHGEELTLKVEGRIDTNTSRQLQERLLLAFQKAGEVVLDLGGTDYISSAGLRVLLIGAKTAKAIQAGFVLLHVQDRVKGVIQMSGFHQFLDIRQ